MTDNLQIHHRDAVRLRTETSGVACGFLAFLFRGLIDSGMLGSYFTLLQMTVMLGLAVAAGIVAVVAHPAGLQSPRLAVGIGCKLGIRAGLRSALVAGALLTALATQDAFTALTATAESTLKHRMWLTLFVSLAALLPGVMCGLVGGAIGACMTHSRIPTPPPERVESRLPWLNRASAGMSLLCVVGLLLPLSFLGRPPRIDPPAITISPAVPPPFHYEPPTDSQSAQIGEIQPAYTQVIDGIREDAPVSLSADGRFLAYGDTTASGSAIGIYDLNHFQKVASIQVPAYPVESLAWSPDQKSLACTLGNGGDRRIWILRVAESKAISLPRPPGRDTPGGELFWWQEHELAFFPTDESPLVFDLQKLVLKPLDDSPFFSKLDAITQRQWREGPRITLPSQKGWKLDVRTVIRSASPPPRLKPEMDWDLFGDSICAMSHPDLPVSFGFDSLAVSEGSKVLCSADGSKVIRLGNGRAEVTYMKKAAGPMLHFEVSMPLADDAIKEAEWKKHVADGELCVLVCAPLINPLNHQVVGPDYQQVRGIAQLVEWKGRQAVFLLQNYSRPIQSTDIATTLHAWADGHKTMWKEPAVNEWWTTIQPVVRALPKTLTDLYMPTFLTLNADASPFVVVKAAERTRPAAKAQSSPAALTPSPLSENSIAMLDADLSSAVSPQGTPSVPALSTATPVAPSGVTEAGVKEFIVAHHTKAARGDVAGMVADYDEVVDFLDKGRVSRSTIQAEELQQREKWPKSTEAVLGSLTVARSGAAWVADYAIEFHNENTTGEWLRGRADLSVTVAAGPAGLRIIAQKAKVHDVSDSRSQAKAGPPVVPITVPRPCFVTSLRTGDHQEIEITDQISFINGVTWHRTYRELSKEGKVLNICRAIYEGSGGVSPDRQNAEIRVQSQGWERGLGGPEFVRLCEKSAVVFVGKAFRFRFTSTGMTEDHGVVFELKK